MRSSGAGQFVFNHVPDGLWVLMAARDTYFPASYQQRRPEGQGKPIQVTADSDTFAELRMFRKGAITGRVLDENGIGMADIPVIAYRARLPVRAAGRAISDDRGVYRIHGLDPGKYWVRTVAHTLDDGTGRLPTFGPETFESREAHTHQAVLDLDTFDADVRPFPGNLFRLRGRLLCEAGGPVTVSLSSDTGRRSVNGQCGGIPYSFTFEAVATGTYEILATKQNGEAGYLESSLDHDTDNVTVQLMTPPTVEIAVRRAGASGAADIPITLTGRRQDLAETEPVQEIMMPRTRLAPGHWELTAQVGAGYYIESIVSPYSLRRPANVLLPPDWFDVFIEPRNLTRITVTVSDQVGRIAGTVTGDGKSVAGVPVFLWPVQEAARRSLHGYRTVLSDVGGHYQFDGLPPADYRLFASFDFTEIDEESISLVPTVTARSDAAHLSTVDLALYLAP